MIGELSAIEIETLLHGEVIARLGCYSDGHTYVVPMMYAYDGHSIIGYSAEGLKLWKMRANPKVCVEVDHIENLSTWRSVIASGTFRELEANEAESALEILMKRLRSIGDGTTVPSHGMDPHARALNRKKFAVYRIDLGHKSGRFEKPEN